MTTVEELASELERRVNSCSVILRYAGDCKHRAGGCFACATICFLTHSTRDTLERVAQELRNLPAPKDTP